MHNAAPYDGRTIANFLLDYAIEFKAELTTLSLMKIVYFAHGTHLAEYGRPLVKQKFEAWENGPVVRVIWDAFKSCGGRIPSDYRARRFDPLKGELVELNELLPDNTKSFLRHVFSEYIVFSAGELVGMTHRPQSPWDHVWTSNHVNLGMHIDNAAIRSWFDRPRKSH